MADNQKQGNQSNTSNQESSQNRQESENQRNFENPQDGREWDNYQTRTLASNPERNDDFSDEQSSNKSTSTDQNQNQGR